MKAIPSKKFKFVSLLLIISAIFVFPALAQEASVPAEASQLTAIQKKLDESAKREEKILALQEKILAEIVTSRKWARRN